MEAFRWLNVAHGIHTIMGFIFRAADVDYIDRQANWGSSGENNLKFVVGSSVLQILLSIILVGGSIFVTGPGKTIYHTCLGIPIIILSVVISILVIISYSILTNQYLQALNTYAGGTDYYSSRLAWYLVGAIFMSVIHTAIYIVFTIKVRSNES